MRTRPRVSELVMHFVDFLDLKKNFLKKRTNVPVLKLDDDRYVYDIGGRWQQRNHDFRCWRRVKDFRGSRHEMWRLLCWFLRSA